VSSPQPDPDQQTKCGAQEATQANQHHPTVQVVSNLGQTVNVKWAADYGKGWVVGIWLVEKLSSEQVIIIL